MSINNNSGLSRYLSMSKFPFHIFLLLIVVLLGCSNSTTKQVGDESKISNEASLLNKKIAYLRFTNGFWQVWLTDAQGSRHVQLTETDVDKTRVSWSSTKQRLLVNSNDGKLFLLNINSKQVTPVPLDSLEVFDAQISTEGRQITYTATTSLQADNAEVWIADLETGSKKKITNNTTVTLYPSWNPKNNSILYSAGSPGMNQELWKAFPEMGESEQLTVSPFSSLDPNANLKGNILYSSNQTGSYNIWLLDGNQKKRQITNANSFDAQPVWNKSGDAFSFFRIINNKKQIWIHMLGSSKEFPITPEDALSRGAVWVE